MASHSQNVAIRFRGHDKATLVELRHASFPGSTSVLSPNKNMGEMTSPKKRSEKT